MNPFSRRTNSWEQKPNALEEALNDLGQDKAVADLTQSNPTKAGFEYPVAWRKALSDSHVMIYDPLSFGMPQARQAIASYYASRGINLDPATIVLTASSSESYAHLLRLLINPHEKVLIPVPSYPLFPYLLDIHDTAYATYQLNPDEAWSIDREHFLKQLDPTVKAVMVVHPNNPTGSYLSSEDVAWLVKTAKEHQLSLIVDEVFMDYALTVKPHSFCAVTEVLTFILGGCSKTLCLPQMKLGWIIPVGPKDLVHGALERLEIICDTYLSVNTPVQLAVAQWLPSVDIIQGQVRRRLKQNLEYVLSKDKIKILMPQAGWYVLGVLPEGSDDETFCLKALREGVCVYPGYFFDMPGDHYIVVSLLTEPEIFSKGWDILCRI